MDRCMGEWIDDILTKLRQKYPHKTFITQTCINTYVHTCFCIHKTYRQVMHSYMHTYQLINQSIKIYTHTYTHTPTHTYTHPWVQIPGATGAIAPPGICHKGLNIA